MASATEVVKTGEHLKSTSYKYFWARHVQKSTLQYDLQVVKELINHSNASIPDEILKDDSIAQTLDKTKEVTGRGFVAKKCGELDIGIVGVGVAGLFSAMVFDWLNDHEDLKGKLKINYDAWEAADEKRLGGRLYTHKFTEGDPVKTHDYYDVGAMRFPNNRIMKRTFQLFHFIGLDKGKGGLIPYFLKGENGVCSAYFNDVSHVGDVCRTDDPFKINSGLPNNGKIDPKFLQTDPSELIKKALGAFLKLTKEKADAAINEPEC